ncbi:SbcC/MukB-like Walker B domain-containing protein [Thiohalocapsa sp. ML1]|uniref:SbcC/MukB-like Walker B domain-containing protein n=1 Tax=Thiohalocapsa sp. ML1 TaxID=1431688 RepID=UPI0007322304|nr:SbcC/MukB-like Walker B domain-containing protein [Thiohalocapsa sp. ML1]
MKRLVRLLLINWYRIEQASIAIDGHTAVIGPNASGKSSLLDAVQAVLVGADKRWWQPNASAGEKSTRSLRDYCLGVVRDPDSAELSAAFRPREQALTYLALVFHDDGGGAPVSIGLALHARLDESQEAIDGRFIADGADLLLPDLLDRTESGHQPKPWKRLREELRGRLGERLRVYPQAGEYQRNLCAVLSDGRRYLDERRWLRALRNAITFAPIRNVSDFVREYVLERRPIEVRALQQALANYRDIQTRTREARQREEALAGMDKDYRRAEQAERLALALRWVAAEAGFNALEAEAVPLRDALSALAKAIAELAERIGALEQQWQAADAALQQATERLAATDVEQQRARIKAQRQSATQDLARIEQAIDGARRGLGKVHALLDQAAQLHDPPLVAALQALTRQLPRDDALLAATWPMAPADVMAAVHPLQPLLAQAVERLRERLETLVVEEAELRRELTALKARIDRLEQGASDLKPATERLIGLLAEHGIPAVPLCDRLDVGEEHWRDALEAFLGGLREALLVAPEQVREAIRLYRNEGRRLGIHGSRVINTLKTDDWRHRREPGSLAEIAVSDDPHALAYLNRQAGNVLRVDTEDELLRCERAITADGMLASGGSVQRLRPEEPMLGRAARARRLEQLKQRFVTDGEAHYAKQQDKQALQRLREEQAQPLARHIDGLPDLTALAAERDDRQRRLEQLAAEEQALQDDTEYQRLKQAVADRRAEREALRAAQDQAKSAHAEHGKRQQAMQLRADALAAQAEAAAAQRSLLQQTDGFDAQLAAERLEQLQTQALFQNENADAWRALGAEAQRRAGTQESTANKARERARDALNEYLHRWSAEDRPAVLGGDDHRARSAWVATELTRVRDTQLARYETEAETALREAEFAFRADFVGKLQESFGLLDEQLKELNRNLRNRPFHGQYYHFTKQPEPDLKDVLAWVQAWSPEQGGDVGGLFDAANDPSHPHREAIARVRSLLMEAGGADPAAGSVADRAGAGRAGRDWHERLSDYRSYFHFDVRMSDRRDGGGNPELLSRRLGKGSGGEHQSPFYVAIGAALAAAYRIERDAAEGLRGGMALAIFDEAFSKLDVQNSAAALGFLDGLGLQVLLAAPDEKYGQIAEHVDSIVNVYRDGGDVHIDTERIKPEARRALAADNPLRTAAEPVDDRDPGNESSPAS